MMKLEFRPCPCSSLGGGPCAETVGMKAEATRWHGVMVKQGLPAISGTAQPLHEVLQNMLDNAVQYTTVGRAHRRCRQPARTASRVITVAIPESVYQAEQKPNLRAFLSRGRRAGRRDGRGGSGAFHRAAHRGGPRRTHLGRERRGRGLPLTTSAFRAAG